MEDYSDRPSGFYGVSKAFSEAIGSIYNEYFGVPSLHLRIGYTSSNDNLVEEWAYDLSHRDAAQIHRKQLMHQ